MPRTRCPVCHMSAGISAAGSLLAHDIAGRRCAGTGLTPDAAALVPQQPSAPRRPTRAEEREMARAELRALTPPGRKAKRKPKTVGQKTAEAAARFRSRRAAAEESRRAYEADMQKRREADAAAGRTPKPPKPEPQGKPKKRRSVWTVRGGLPGLGKR